MIEVRQLSKRYGDVHAVRGVDLRVEAGEVFGLIGHNGAGKSTLFKMMLGLVPASGGEIRIDGQSVTGPHFRQVRRAILPFWIPGKVAAGYRRGDTTCGIELPHGDITWAQWIQWTYQGAPSSSPSAEAGRW